jgi:hypothetical protein
LVEKSKFLIIVYNSRANKLGVAIREPRKGGPDPVPQERISLRHPQIGNKLEKRMKKQ